MNKLTPGAPEYTEDKGNGPLAFSIVVALTVLQFQTMIALIDALLV